MAQRHMCGSEGGPVRLRGIIVPAGWDETGRVTATGLSTFDEQFYQLDTEKVGSGLEDFLRKRVEVLGEFIGEGSNKVFAVRNCFSEASEFEVD
jgi:hypothetical protein